MFGRAGLESPKTRQSMDPATLAMLQTLLTSAEVTQAAERVRILVELTPDISSLARPKRNNPQVTQSSAGFSLWGFAVTQASPGLCL